MRVVILPSGTGDGAGFQFLSSYLINGTVAIDAGCLAFALSPRQVQQVKHIFLTHTHLDHIASLPMLLDIAFTGTPDCVTVHANAHAAEVLRRDVFNDRVWPDFLRLSTPEAPFLKLHTLEDNAPVRVEGLRLTPIPVDHSVPTVGYLVEDDSAAVLFTGDTGPTDAIWERARRHPRLRAVFVETTFPSSMSELARVSCHLTPTLLAGQLEKLRRPAQAIVVHVHPRHRDDVARELEQLRLPGVVLAGPGESFSW